VIKAVKVTKYELNCDRCGETMLSDNGTPCYEDSVLKLLFLVKKSNWKMSNDEKYYICPNCVNELFKNEFIQIKEAQDEKRG
jgi:ribosomal protein S27AE